MVTVGVDAVCAPGRVEVLMLFRQLRGQFGCIGATFGLPLLAPPFLQQHACLCKRSSVIQRGSQTRERRQDHLWTNVAQVELPEKPGIAGNFPPLPQPPRIMGKVLFKGVRAIQRGRSQVKQLCQRYDFNNKISGIWLQQLKPMKPSRGQSSFLVCRAGMFLKGGVLFAIHP